MEVELKVVNNSGYSLSRATAGAAGIDLRRGTVLAHGTHGVEVYDTGIAVAIPEGYCGVIVARSSLHGRGWRLANAVGIIDSDYRGNILLALQPLASKSHPIGPADKVAQLIVVPIPTIIIQEVSELDQTARGSGGFGSTGK